MKRRLHHILILSFVAFLAATIPAYAQESGLPESESTEADFDRIEKEKVMYSPGEIDTRYTSGSSADPDPGDSITNQTTTTTTPAPIAPKIKSEKQAPVIKPTVEKQSKAEDDSILSFNFLYYIIQKYKMQDIVD
jgi:hypothetical protein